MHPRPRHRLSLLPTALLTALLAACGGGGGGGSGDPPQVPNDPPVLEVPAGIGGTGAQRSYALATGGTDQLVFTATDPDGDPLLWQLQMNAGGSAAAGLTFQTPVNGGSFTLDLAPVATPVAVVATLLVEDDRGAAQAIDLRIVRSGAPTLFAVAPDTAFTNQPQQVTVTGGALALGGAVQTAIQFDGVPAGTTTVVDDATLLSSTPAAGSLPGPTVVQVTHQFGTAQLPGSAFTMLTFPPALGATDVRLDAGAGGAVEVAHEGRTVHLVFLEGTSVAHRRSSDAGATWSAPQLLSGGEVASEPRVVMVGDDVTIVWIADGNGVNARSSHDGGASFAAALPLDGAGLTVQRPRLVATGARRHVVWQRGSVGLGTARLVATASTDAGDTWLAAALIADGGANQYDPHLVASGTTALVAFVDDRQGALVPGIYTSRTTTGGVVWGGAQRRSLTNAAATTPRLCAADGRVWLTWLRNDVLEFLGSADGGLSWPTVAAELRPSGQGAVTEPSLTCEGNRLYAAYVLAGTSVEVARVGGVGAQPQHLTVSTVTGPAGEPRLRSSGNYVAVTWRDGTVAGGSARLATAVSVDLGAHFTNPTGFGDASAAQELPQLVLDGARLLLLWQDHRTTPAGIFTNRTVQ